MQCISPLWVRKTGQHVPCGKCNFCLQVKRGDWSFRLMEEFKVSSSAYFLTFTYADDQIPFSEAGLPELRKRDVQLFKKKLRKHHDQTYKRQKVKQIPSIRYYTVGEYGTKGGRPHYHSIIFNVHPETMQKVDAIWSQGLVHVGQVSEGSIHYVTKYVINTDVGNSIFRSPPFLLCRVSPALAAITLRLIEVGISMISVITLWCTVSRRVYHGSIKTSFLMFIRESLCVWKESVSPRKFTLTNLRGCLIYTQIRWPTITNVLSGSTKEST